MRYSTGRDVLGEIEAQPLWLAAVGFRRNACNGNKVLRAGRPTVLLRETG